MNCSQIQELLSAYYDGELADQQRARVAEHLDQCAGCAREIAGYEKLSAMATAMAEDLPLPGPPEAGWRELEKQLDAPSPVHAAGAKQLRWLAWTQRPWMVAAAVLVAVTVGWSTYRLIGPGEMHTAMLDHYVNEFQRDPASAQKLLLAKYPNQALAPAEIVQHVGYRPVAADGLPEQYSIESTVVMEMPCCTCVQTVCKRRDGTLFVMFEHDEENSGWLGDRPGMMEDCGDKKCCVMELDRHLAATWKQGKRYITLIGARSVDEIDALIRWIDGKEKTKQS